MLDELRLMAIFLKTVELSSFRRAASELKLSPSVISHHIAQLEERLGVVLLYRSTRKLTITSEGKILFESAKKMMAAAQEGLDAMTFYTNEPLGSLNISVPSILARSFLMEDIAAFVERYPKVKLTINFSDEPKDLIRDALDLAIRIGSVKDLSLRTRKIFQFERRLVANAKVYANRKPIKTPEDLIGQKWIGFRMLPNFRILTDAKGNKYRVDFTPAIFVDNVDAATQLMKAGAGLFTPPDFLVDDYIKSGELVEILPKWRLPPLDVFVIWHKNASSTSLAARFKDFMVERSNQGTELSPN